MAKIKNPVAKVKKIAKMYAYRVLESDYRQVKVGSMLVYKRNYGKHHTSFIFGLTTGKDEGCWSMVKISPCWRVGNGSIQFEEPPTKKGKLTAYVIKHKKLPEKK